MNILDRKGVETVVLSIGGSLVVPKTGIDVDFLKKLNVFIRKQVRESNRRFFIVIGGGSTAREYRDAARDVVGYAESLVIYDWDMYRQIFGNAIAMILATNDTPREAIQKAEAEINAVLPDEGILLAPPVIPGGTKAVGDKAKASQTTKENTSGNANSNTSGSTKNVKTK
jgi:hypothetical protein